MEVTKVVENEDGSVDIYISHNKMTVDNWISTAGYKEAILFFRWLIAEEMPETPTVSKGKIKK